MPTSAAAPASHNAPTQETIEPAHIELDFDTALARARSEGKALVVEFTSPDCPHSARMQDEVHPLASFAALTHRVVWLQLTADDPVGAARARQFGFRSTPTVALLAHDGETVYFRHGGFLQAQGLFHDLDLMLPRSKPANEITDELADDKQPVGLDAVKRLLVSGRIEEADRLLHSTIDDDPANVSGEVDDALVMLGLVENAEEEASDLARGHWLRVLKEFPNADRAPDSALYLMKWLKAAGHIEKSVELRRLLQSYPAKVDADAFLAVVDQP